MLKCEVELFVTVMLLTTF